MGPGVSEPTETDINETVLTALGGCDSSWLNPSFLSCELMRVWLLILTMALVAPDSEAIEPLYCLHEVYRLENEGRDFDVYWIQIEPNRFLAVYDDPWKVRDPGDVSLDTHVSSLIDDHLWIGPRLHSLKYRIERWHKMKIDRAECWSESPLTFWIRMPSGRWILARQHKNGRFRAEIVSTGPK